MNCDMSRGHETFDHTADIGIRAWGADLIQVFEEAATALFTVIAELSTVSVRRTIVVKVRGDSDEELFLAWLKELLFIFETKHLLCSHFKVLNLKPGALTAEIGGEPIDSAKHLLGREVKAITLHQFKLVKEKARYFAEVILDI